MAVNLETPGNKFIYKRMVWSVVCQADFTSVGILSSNSRMPPPTGKDAPAADFASTAPSCHLFPCDLQRPGLSHRPRLGIAGMTAMLSLGTLLWELDGWHWGFQCESATCHSDTHSTAEGNVSRTLQATGTNFCDGSWRVGPIGEINEFLKEAWFSLLVLCSSKISVPLLIFSHVLILALALWHLAFPICRLGFAVARPSSLYLACLVLSNLSATCFGEKLVTV